MSQSPISSDHAVGIEHGSAKPWITPSIEQIPLHDAQTGNAANGPSTDGMQTYPS